MSPEQLRGVLLRASLDTLPEAQTPLLDMMRGVVFTAYARIYPARSAVIRRLLHGDTATEAADGQCDRTTAGRWLWQFLGMASDVVDRQAMRGHDRDILLSICSLTHGRTARGGSGDRDRLGATVCPGCGARAE